MIENLARRSADDFPANRQVRTIARCIELLDVALHPHEFLVNGPAFNAAGELVTNSAIQARPCYQNLVINQYHARSRQDWVAKFQHANATAHPSAPQDEIRLFDHLAETCQVSDETIRAFIPAVRALLGDRPVAGPSPEARPGLSQPGLSQREAPVSRPVEGWQVGWRAGRTHWSGPAVSVWSSVTGRAPENTGLQPCAARPRTRSIPRFYLMTSIGFGIFRPTRKRGRRATQPSPGRLGTNRRLRLATATACGSWQRTPCPSSLCH